MLRIPPEVHAHAAMMAEAQGKVTIYGMATAALVAVYAFMAAYILEESL